MTPHQEASEIAETLASPGWAHIKALFDEHIATPKDELFEIMCSRPETITGKSAFMRAGRARGCADLLEAINDKLKILAQPPKRGGE